VTCIVGYVCDTGSVILGGDSAATNECGDLIVDGNPKCWMLGHVAIGMSGSVLIGNAV